MIYLTLLLIIFGKNLLNIIKDKGFKMLWHWLTLAKLFNKMGNYFYNLHVNTLRRKQRKEQEMPYNYGKGTHSKGMKKKKKKVIKKKK